MKSAELTIGVAKFKAFCESKGWKGTELNMGQHKGIKYYSPDENESAAITYYEFVHPENVDRGVQLNIRNNTCIITEFSMLSALTNLI